MQTYLPTSPEYPAVVAAGPWFLALGDSKTQNGTWLSPLAAALSTQGRTWSSVNRGLGSQTVASTLSLVQDRLSIPSPSRVGIGANPSVARSAPTAILINLGVNDSFFGLPTQAAWQASYLGLIDVLQAHWPTAPTYLMRPWIRYPNAGVTAAGDMDTLASWIATIVGLRSRLFVGPDERVWLKGSDDGATMTIEGIHYSAAGTVVATAQWAAVLAGL